MQSNHNISRTEEQIGRLLVEGGFITEENLQEAVERVQSDGINLRSALTSKGHIAEETYSTFLSMQTRVPLVDLRQVEVSQDAVRLVPEDVARQYKVLPLVIDGDALRVAMDDPRNVDAINALNAITGKRIRPRLPTQGSVDDALLRQYYGTAPRMKERLKTILSGSADPTVAGQSQPLPAGERTAATASALEPAVAAAPLAPEEVTGAPVVQALDMIMNQAVRDRASDIHIEPTEDSVRVRYRIDGALHNAATLPKGAQSALISRIKVLARMDIAERRRPQDGNFAMSIGDQEVDFRVASMDTSHDEKVVLRILNKTSSIFSLIDLGFEPNTLQVYSQLLESPFGMILVSGPTGSGKTTSLYASLLRLDAAAQNIMTIEDPIEYRFEGINQTQVNEQANITFAGGLRGIFRMDPDIVLLGEIRDRETAEVATQAALTGHLVLTSIHANAAAAITRLVDLGVEPFLVTSAVIGSVAQRLVRRVCPYCKTLTAADPAEINAYQTEMNDMITQFYSGRGCNMCSRSGFTGRVGVYEIMVMTDQIRTLVNQGTAASEIREEAIRGGMVTMRRDGMLKVKDGLTTPREVLRHVFTLS